MAIITVYTTEPCRFCAAAKRMLEAHGLEFREVNLAKDDEGRLQLARRTGMATFPQVLLDDKPLGGFHDVKVALESGRLQKLLAA